MKNIPLAFIIALFLAVGCNNTTDNNNNNNTTDPAANVPADQQAPPTQQYSPPPAFENQGTIGDTTGAGGGTGVGSGATGQRLNPPHGEPGHRCDIAVGAPLPN